MKTTPKVKPKLERLCFVAGMDRTQRIVFLKGLMGPLKSHPINNSNNKKSYTTAFSLQSDGFNEASTDFDT